MPSLLPTPLTIDALLPVIAERDAEVALLKHMVDKLKLQLARRVREQYGRSSEQLDTQLTLIGTEAPKAAEASPTQSAKTTPRKPRRAQRKLPEHLPRETRVHHPKGYAADAPCACSECGGRLRQIGEDVAEQLEYVPGHFKVIRHVRPKLACVRCEGSFQAMAPSRPIARGLPGPALLAHVMVTKYCDHLPLYRQHQRLLDAGFELSRPWLTQLVQQGAQLLQPIYEAQLKSIIDSRVKSMDETPIKAGRAGPGKMKGTYFWPIHGEHDEVCFPHFESRRHEHVEQALGVPQTPGSVLLTDGYAAYSRYAQKTGITHAQCWTHSRRGFFEAQDAEPQLAAEALSQIGALYEIEDEIRRLKLTGENKRVHRLTHSKPRVEQFFEWVQRQFERQGLLPSNPLTKALAYVRERRAGLEVFLGDADVPMDTNHLERALRPVPMGRRNWLFCWTEVGAQHAGILQSLVVTCRLHGIDPYTYLVDVLQRVGQHPASRVAELTPRLWKQHFADKPLRSDLHKPVA